MYRSNLFKNSIFSGLLVFQSLISFANLPVTPSEWGSLSVVLSKENAVNGAFTQYDALQDFGTENCGWALLTAPYDGIFSMSSALVNQNYEIAVFRSETIDLAAELKAANAFLLVAHNLVLGKALNIDENSDDEFHPALFQLLKGQSVLVYVNSLKGTVLNLNVDLKRNPSLEARKAVIPFEYRKNTGLKSLRIVVRDAVTGLPVKARINIQGLKGIDNVYNASDFTFDLAISKESSISCDAAGYFNRDVVLSLVVGKDNVVTIQLSPFSSQENMRLDGVQFKEGTDEPLPSAYQDLSKLLNFLNANPKIHVEIQGHVNAPNNDSKAAYKLSEKRAKFVYDYLIEKGVSPERLEYVGYGNSQMIYNEPKNEIEEQANRRVEIKILD